MLTLTLCACSSGSSTSSITVAGSTTCLPIAEIAAEGFKEETGIDVPVSGLGSSAGIEAVSAGTADIASSSRGLNADEQDLGLTPIVIAHDGIAVIVNDDNPVDNLRLSSSAISTPARLPIERGRWRGPEDSGHQPRRGVRYARGLPYHRDGWHAVRSPLGCSFFGYGPGARRGISFAWGHRLHFAGLFVDSLNAKTSVKRRLGQSC